MISATILINLLLASAALAAPSLDDRLQRRNAAGQESSTTKYLGESDLVDFYNNWNGAMYFNGNNTFQSVTAAVTIPTYNSGSVNVWIGIDGHTYGTALHTGLTLSVGHVTPWYRLYPDDPKLFPTSLSINTGDVVRMTVSTATDHFGFVQIQNLNSTLAVTEQIWIMNPDGGLRRSEAMWFAAWNGLVANFDALVLTDVMATTTAGVNIGPDEPGYNITLLNHQEDHKAVSFIYVDQSTHKITIKNN